MKKVWVSLFLFALIVFGSQKVSAIRYEDAVEQSKPVAIFIYAPWADGLEPMKQAFQGMESSYGSQYNFVWMNIATDEAKVFNQRFYIYPNLPYVLLMRDKGKFLRFLDRKCVLDNACFENKLNMFNH